MKYTVIVGGNAFTIVADRMDRRNGVVVFEDCTCDPKKHIAEFNANKVDGIIWEDNNASD